MATSWITILLSADIVHDPAMDKRIARGWRQTAAVRTEAPKRVLRTVGIAAVG